MFFWWRQRLGLAAYSRYALDDRHALAVRIERFRDPENGISGSAQTLTEGTVTWELRPLQNLIIKFEGRQDHSTAPVLAKGANQSTSNQTLIVIGAVAMF